MAQDVHDYLVKTFGNQLVLDHEFVKGTVGVGEYTDVGNIRYLYISHEELNNKDIDDDKKNRLIQRIIEKLLNPELDDAPILKKALVAIIVPRYYEERNKSDKARIFKLQTEEISRLNPYFQKIENISIREKLPQFVRNISNSIKKEKVSDLKNSELKSKKIMMICESEFKNNPKLIGDVTEVEFEQLAEAEYVKRGAPEHPRVGLDELLRKYKEGLIPSQKTKGDNFVSYEIVFKLLAENSTAKFTLKSIADKTHLLPYTTYYAIVVLKASHKVISIEKKGRLSFYYLNSQIIVNLLQLTN